MQSLQGNQIEISLGQLESMALLVENAVATSIRALGTLDTAAAWHIIENDKAINSFEIDIDNSTYTIFALSLHDIPPLSLRKILAIQKINPMLERIGDHAANIAEAVIRLAEDGYCGERFSLDDMAKECSAILHDAIKGFLEGDMVISGKLLRQDQMIDSMYQSINQSIKNAMLSIPPQISFESGFALFEIGRNLERIADLSMNIGEETLFAIEGLVVKHRKPDGMQGDC